MGGKYSKSSSSREQAGIQVHEMYILVGYLSETYDDVASSRISVSDGRHLIQNHLKRLSRYALDPNRVGQNNKIFPNDEFFVEIYEKYRDPDGVHAWSLVLQFKTTSKTFKALYGIPGSASVTSSLTSVAGNPSIRQQNPAPPRNNGGTSSQGNNATPPRQQQPSQQPRQQQQQPRQQQQQPRQQQQQPRQQPRQQQQYQQRGQTPTWGPQQQGQPYSNIQSPNNLPMDNVGPNMSIIDEMERYSGQQNQGGMRNEAYGSYPGGNGVTAPQGGAGLTVQAQQPDVYEFNLSKMQ